MSQVSLHGRCFTVGLLMLCTSAGWAVEPPTFDRLRGISESPFDLTLTAADPDWRIVHTTDGRVPGTGIGSDDGSPVELRITGTSVIRARCHDNAGNWSRTVTHTYLFVDDVLEQAAGARGMPSDTEFQGWGTTAMDDAYVAEHRQAVREALLAAPCLLVGLDQDDLFDAETGIMADVQRQGREWEKPVSLELVFPDGALPDHQVDCGLQLAGRGSAITEKKKPFELRFRSDYGPTLFEHPFFGSAPQRGVDRIRLRISRPKTSALRQFAQQWIDDVYAAMSGDGQRGRYAHLFFNGVYWGLYNAVEVADSDFASEHLGGDRADWDALRGDLPYDGISHGWYLYESVDRLDQADRYAVAARAIDLPRYVDYRLMLAMFAGELDYSFEDRFLYNGHIGFGLAVYPWDTDVSMNFTFPGSPEYSSSLGGGNENDLFTRLQVSPVFRSLVADRLQRHFGPGGALTSERLLASLERRAAAYDAARRADIARWLGQEFSAVPAWDDPLQQARDWTVERPIFIRQELQDRGLGQALTAPELTLPSEPPTAPVDIDLSNPTGSGLLAYTLNGPDPRCADGSLDGQASTSSAASLTLRIDEPTTIRARLRDGEEWSALVERTLRLPQDLQDLRVSELMYHPLAGPDPRPGLQALYAHDGSGRNSYRQERVDDSIDFTWDGAAPAPGIDEGFVASWAGWLRAPVDDTYTIELLSDSPVRLRLAGGVLVEDWFNHSDDLTTYSHAIDLNAGEPVRLGLEFRSADTTARLRLAWSRDGAAATTIPSTALLSDLPRASDGEFVELHAAGDQALDLSGLALDGGIRYRFPPHSVLPAGGRLVLVANPRFFNERYPGVEPAGVYAGSLSNEGETLILEDPSGAEIWSVDYDDAGAWPRSADGAGNSLVHRGGDPDDPANWSASAEIGGSPGSAGAIAADGEVLISEALTHSDPEVDWIELYNPGTTEADVSGWYLTDDRQNPTAWRIPDGSRIAGGGYLVVDEDDFGGAFKLSSLGDEEVVLFAADSSGGLTGYSHGFRFGAQFNGVTFGRHLTSVGEEHFVRQRAATLGAANAGVLVGPVVLSEICYNPSDGDMEFVEIVNMSDSAVDLGPNGEGNPWRLEGSGYEFPDGALLEAGAVALVVGGDPASFRSRHSVDAAIPIFGPFPGKLDNGGETIALEQPDGEELVDGTAVVPRVVIDQLDYDDDPPWPTTPDTVGDSLQRVALTVYGDDRGNWLAASPTPGSLPDQALRRISIDAEPGSGIEARVDGGAPVGVPAVFDGLSPAIDHWLELQRVDGGG